MRSEQDMLRLVREKAARLRRRRRVAMFAATGAAVVVVGGLGLTRLGGDGEDQVATGLTRPSDSTSQPSRDQVVVPELVGLTFDEAVDGLRAAGFSGVPSFVRSRYVASDVVESDLVMGQAPPAGSAADVNAAVAIDVSAGGPVVRFGELPDAVRSFTSNLAGYDETEPILAVSTEHGTAYKTDAWLFGPCPAVDDAYRSFADPTYGDRCY
jgi:hypothetical protein